MNKFTLLAIKIFKEFENQCQEDINIDVGPSGLFISLASTEISFIKQLISREIIGPENILEYSYPVPFDELEDKEDIDYILSLRGKKEKQFTVDLTSEEKKELSRLIVSLEENVSLIYLDGKTERAYSLAESVSLKQKEILENIIENIKEK